MTAEVSPPKIEQVFISQRPHLVNVAARIVGCAGQAEDIVHDAYLKCCNACPGHMRSQASYITQVVRNLALDHYRRQQVENRIFAPEEAGEDVPGATSSPERAAIAQQQLQGLLAVLATLPARTCEAFSSYYFQEKTQTEIAKQLGVSATLINFMLRDARVAVACCMAALLVD